MEEICKREFISDIFEWYFEISHLTQYLKLLINQDMVERFQLFIFLTVTTVQNFSDIDWDIEHFWVK